MSEHTATLVELSEEDMVGGDCKCCGMLCLLFLACRLLAHKMQVAEYGSFQYFVEQRKVCVSVPIKKADESVC